MRISKQPLRRSPVVSGLEELVALNRVCLVSMWPRPECVAVVLEDPSYVAHGHRSCWPGHRTSRNSKYCFEGGIPGISLGLRESPPVPSGPSSIW